MAKTSSKENMIAHHAYCMAGGHADAVAIEKRLEAELGVSFRGNPDYSRRRFETFTIDDARDLKAEAETKPIGESGLKLFVISADSMTIEAQNALLKLFEEPPEYAHFYLTLPSADLLQKTVLSRVRMIDRDLELSGNGNVGENMSEEDNERAREIAELASSFVTAPLGKRLEIVKKMTEEISKDKKSKRFAVDFLNEVEKIIYEKNGVKKATSALEAVSFARKYINDRSPSLKMLLDYVALNIVL